MWDSSPRLVVSGGIPAKTLAGGLSDRFEGTRGIAFAYLLEPSPVRRIWLASHS